MGQIIARTHVLLKRAILTLTALPDRELRYLSGPKNSLPEPARDPGLAYDSEAAKEEVARALRFRPTPKDVSRYLTVWQWIMWLKRQGEEGEDAVRLIIHRAHTRQGWSSTLRRRFDRSDDTLTRWYQNAVMRIAFTFAADIAGMD